MHGRGQPELPRAQSVSRVDEDELKVIAESKGRPRGASEMLAVRLTANLDPEGGIVQTCVVRHLVAVFVVLVVGISACDGDDDDNGGGSPTPDYSEPAYDEGCSDDFPRRVAEPSGFTGFVVLCDIEGGTEMSVRNIGNVVLVATPDRQQWQAADATPGPEPTFAHRLIQTTIPAVCGAASCTVPPGATLTISAGVPARAILDVAAAETVAATLARSLADQVNARIGTPGQRFADAIVNCAQQAPNALQGAAWEEAFRNTLIASSSCLAVMDQLAGTDPVARETATQRLIAQARRYTSGAWIDGLLIAAKAIR